eukprot:1851367-Alexandrium_andersonii.AAC.1
MYAEHHAQDVHRVTKRLPAPAAQWHEGRRLPPHRAKSAPVPKHLGAPLLVLKSAHCSASRRGS